MNIVVACKICAKSWQNRKIHVLCDNLAVVEVIQNGKVRDSILVTCACNIWLNIALNNIQLKVSHVA